MCTVQNNQHKIQNSGDPLTKGHPRKKKKKTKMQRKLRNIKTAFDCLQWQKISGLRSWMSLLPHNDADDDDDDDHDYYDDEGK